MFVLVKDKTNPCKIGSPPFPYWSSTSSSSDRFLFSAPLLVVMHRTCVRVCVCVCVCVCVYECVCVSKCFVHFFLPWKSPPTNPIFSFFLSLFLTPIECVCVCPSVRAPLKEKKKKSVCMCVCNVARKRLACLQCYKVLPLIFMRDKQNCEKNCEKKK